MLSRGAPSASVLVIGGAGFVGESIIARLQSSGYAVSCLDIAMPSKAVQDVCVSFHTGEITDNDCLADVFSAVRPEIVIHLASFGMSGADMLNPKCFGVNVTGTDNILNACIAWNVQLLIYTSSYNVIFGGQEIYNGVESRMQYFPRKMAVDHYGQTKALAEQAIISANGSRCSNGQTFLKTCSIRPAAIYGENERRHFSRIIQHIDSGVFIFRIGTALVDWVYIDNLVDAYVLVIKKYEENVQLSRDAQAAPFGQCYAISDGTPIDNFEFLRPVCEARLCKYPDIVIPTNIMLCIAYVIESVHLLLKSLGIPNSPFLTISEVHKVGVTHYFSIEKARAELGYDPKVTTTEGSRRIAEHYRVSISNENFFRPTHFIWWLLCDGGMLLTYYLAYCDNINPIFAPVYRFALFLFGSQLGISYVFILAVLAHVGEGLYAYSVAGSKGCNPSRRLLWLMQTLFLGYPSLSLLLSRPDFKNKK